MIILTNTLAILIAVIHFYFMYLEMVLWTKPKGLKIFRQSLEQAQASKVLAANQGLYNGFLAVGLLWSVLHPNPVFAVQLKYFFLGCVIIAGVYGARTVSGRIMYIQAMPAVFTAIIVFITSI